MVVLQLSDPHIKLAGAADGGESPSSRALREAVAGIGALPSPPDAVIVTGDLADSGAEAEYDRIGELLRPLTMPVYVLPGNHDDRDRMLRRFGPQGASPLPGFVQFVVDLGPTRLVGLDTVVPGSGGGRLDAVRLDWLDARLAEAPDRPTLLCLHHPPFATGLTVFDEIGLDGADRLAEIVARHRQVEVVAAGHVHATMIRRFAGSMAVTCASTAHQFVADPRQSTKLVAAVGPPAGLRHVWSAASGWVTQPIPLGQIGPIRTLHDGERWCD